MRNEFKNTVEAPKSTNSMEQSPS